MQPLSPQQIRHRTGVIEERLRRASIVGRHGGAVLYSFNDGYHVLRCQSNHGLTYFSILPSGEIKDLFVRLVDDRDLRLVIQTVAAMRRTSLEQKVRAWARTVSTGRY